MSILIRKKILITGKNSYVGNALDKYLSLFYKDYQVTKISMKTDDWKMTSFDDFDVIVHVAGIAHTSKSKSKEQLYYDVNTKLTLEVAKKAKKSGVKQFIFLSSIIVYGDSRIENNVITITTIPAPSDFYGKSKLLAEEGLIMLQDIHFKVSIIRAPMIYGKNSKGNFSKISKLAKLTPIFPNYTNQRSMLYIGNLNIVLKKIIDYELTGILFPQNKEYVSTSNMVKEIAMVNNNNVSLIKFFNRRIV